MSCLDKFMIRAKFMAKNFWKDEQGDVNIVSIVILIGIAVLLAVLFKDQIGDLVTGMFGDINDNADGLTSETLKVPEPATTK